jgi:NTP pyrophosphatase (non-canonical NTP hydrolase)
MNFKEYQETSEQFNIFKDKDENFIYLVLGLLGESGEIAEKVKKILRDENNILTKEKKLELIKELGDVLWYISQLTIALDFNLEEVAIQNLKKLSSRSQRNKIKGDGDNR